jgi:hypothetical protein
MNAKRIFDIFKQSRLEHVKVPLGRWNTSHNYRQATLKIKYANEDNSCDYYKNTKQTQQNNENEELDDDSLYIYSMGYESLPTTVYTKSQIISKNTYDPYYN